MDGFRQQITGAILSTFGGQVLMHIVLLQKSQQFVDDYPAYNLIAKRTDLLEVGGFNNKFYGGEDTALCLKLIIRQKENSLSP